MKRIIVIILSVSLCIILYSCLSMEESENDYFDGKFSVINKSSDTIYWDLAVITERDSPVCRIFSEKIEISPYSLHTERFNIKNLKDTPFLQMDIWKKSTLEKYTKEYIKEHDIVDKRYIVDYYDLEKLKFKIVYDGTE